MLNQYIGNHNSAYTEDIRINDLHKKYRNYAVYYFVHTTPTTDSRGYTQIRIAKNFAVYSP